MNKHLLSEKQSNTLSALRLFVLLFVCFLTTVVFAQDRSTTLNLTLDNKPIPKDNRIFGYNSSRTLGGGLPEGGEYSGPGVKDGKFNPAQAGNGKWTITYSKPGYRSSSVTIEVHHAPENISTAPVCDKCGGKQTEVCPVCHGSKKVNNKECERCKGEGTIPCQKCLGDDEIDDSIVIPDLAPLLSCSRITYDELSWGRTDEFVLTLNPKFEKYKTEKYTPSMYFYIVEKATGKFKKYILPNMDSEKLEYSSVSVKNEQPFFTFKVEGTRLIESNIRLIEIATKYGIYSISLYFDLDDIMNDGKLLEKEMKAKYFSFNGKYYRIPQSIIVEIDDINETWDKITSDKGWETEEMCSGWLLQNNNKGGKRILDNNRMLRMETNKQQDNNSKDIDACWSDIKQQLEDKDAFWDKWYKTNSPKEQDDSSNLSNLFTQKS